MVKIHNFNISELLRLRPGLKYVYGSETGIDMKDVDYLNSRVLSLKKMLVILRNEIQTLQFQATKQEIPGIRFILNNFHLFYSDDFSDLNATSKECMFRILISSNIQRFDNKIYVMIRNNERYFQSKMKVIHSPA